MLCGTIPTFGAVKHSLALGDVRVAGCGHSSNRPLYLDYGSLMHNRHIIFSRGGYQSLMKKVMGQAANVKTAVTKQTVYYLDLHHRPAAAPFRCFTG